MFHSLRRHPEVGQHLLELGAVDLAVVRRIHLLEGGAEQRELVPLAGDDSAPPDLCELTHLSDASAIDVIRAEWAKIREQGVTPEELQDAKRLRGIKIIKLKTN